MPALWRILSAACLVLAAAGLWWLAYGRGRALAADMPYQRALSVLSRAEALAMRRDIRVTAPTRACAGYYGWRRMLPPERAAALPGLARDIQAEALAIRREAAAVVMEAGHSPWWRRMELTQVVGMIEEASSPDFVVRYGYAGGRSDTVLRVPVLSIYLDGRDNDVGKGASGDGT